MPPSVRAIINTVAAEHGLRPRDVVAGSRLRRHARARFAAVQLARDTLLIGGKAPSFPLIAVWFGYKDHTSVIWAYRGGRPARVRA